MGEPYIRDVHASWKKVKCLYLYLSDTTFTQHKHNEYSLQTKGQIPADKIFSKGTWSSKLFRGEFVARVIVLRFLLDKKKIGVNRLAASLSSTCQSRPHMRFIVTTFKMSWKPVTNTRDRQNQRQLLYLLTQICFPIRRNMSSLMSQNSLTPQGEQNSPTPYGNNNITFTHVIRSCSLKPRQICELAGVKQTIASQFLLVLNWEV